MADYIETIVHVRLCQVALKAPIDATPEERAIVEQLNKQLSDELCLNVRCKEYFNGKFCAKAATYAHPGLQRIEPVFSKQHVAFGHIGRRKRSSSPSSPTSCTSHLG